jgi:hypothetical protein
LEDNSPLISLTPLSPILDPTPRLSSITFGAPPVTSPALPPFLLGNPRVAAHTGIVLSVVNEYDLVPRADGPYVRSLVDLYRSIYNLPPIQDDAALQLPRFSFDAEPGPRGRLGGQAALWALPKPVYGHVGKLVVLKVQLAESSVGSGDGGEEDELVLRAVAVGPERFAQLLFCNVSVHRKVCYEERVGMLLEGRFNGRERW